MHTSSSPRAPSTSAGTQVGRSITAVVSGGVAAMSCPVAASAASIVWFQDEATSSRPSPSASNSVVE
jgi:hypothetical protein